MTESCCKRDRMELRLKLERDRLGAWTSVKAERKNTKAREFNTYLIPPRETRRQVAQGRETNRLGWVAEEIG